MGMPQQQMIQPEIHLHTEQPIKESKKDIPSEIIIGVAVTVVAALVLTLITKVRK